MIWTKKLGECGVDRERAPRVSGQASRVFTGREDFKQTGMSLPTDWYVTANGLICHSRHNLCSQPVGKEGVRQLLIAPQRSCSEAGKLIYFRVPGWATR